MSFPRLYAIVDASRFSDADAMFAAAEELVGAGVTLVQYRNKYGNARQMLEQARELKRRLSSHPNVAKDATLGWGSLGALGSGSQTRVRLIMNDRADVCVAADFDGLHLGQDDLSPEGARRIIGGPPAEAATRAAEAAIDIDTDDAAPKRSTPASQNRARWRPQRWATQNPTDSGGTDKPRARWLGVSTHNPEQLAEADRTSADYLAIGPVFATSSKVNPDPVVGLEGVRRARELTRKPLVAIGGITRANARSVIEAGADAVAVISDLLPDPGKSAEEFLRILE